MRTKKAAMLRKARSQKHYFNTLKVAAELDSAEQPSKAERRLLPGIFLGLVFAVTSSIGVGRLWENIFSKSTFVEEIAETKADIDILTRTIGDLKKNKTHFIVDPKWDLIDTTIHLKKTQTKLEHLQSKNFQKLILSAFIALFVFISTVYLYSMKQEKERLGMTWVEYIKYFFKTKANSIKSLVKRAVKRPTPEQKAFVIAATNSDGSLNKSVLKRHIENNL